MSLSSILQLIQRKGQIAPALQKEPRKETTRPAVAGRAPSDRPVDPVVARLKAARRAERERKEQELRAKRGKPERAKPKAKSPAKPKAKTAETSPQVEAKPKKPKMSFSELMKRALDIDQKKLSIPIAMDELSRTKGKVTEGGKVQERGRITEGRKVKGREPSRSRERPGRGKTTMPAKASPQIRQPIAPRGPGAKLQEKYKRKEDSESDMDSFIESENEGYDRDEIWAMFNKGRKREYYDEDDSDMEATGAEVLEEERISGRSAIEEDRREQLEEERRAALKRKRRA